MTTLSKIERKYVNAVFSFIKLVERVAMAPYPVAMLKTLEWLAENNQVEIKLNSDNKIKPEDEEYSSGDHRVYIHASDGMVCVSDKMPSKWTDSIGRTHVENHIVLGLSTSLEGMLSEGLHNFGTRPSDITEYKRVCSKQLLMVEYLKHYEDALTYVIDYATVRSETEDEALSTFDKMLSGETENSSLKIMSRESPKYRPSMPDRPVLSEMHCEDNDDDND